MTKRDCRCYVYALVDPRSGEPFYVGKGAGRRAWSHMPDDSLKGIILSELGPAGPDVLILAEGLTDAQALVIEADLIQLLRGTLTNIQGGNTVAYVNRWAARRLAYVDALPRGYRESPYYRHIVADLRQLATWGHL